MDAVLPDTSVIINEQIESQIKSGSLRPSEIVILQAVVDELHSQAEAGRGRGIAGLQALESLRSVSEEFGITMTYRGQHVSASDASLADGGRIDALIIDGARECNAILYTSDSIQHMTAKSQGIAAVLLQDTRGRHDADGEPLEFLKFFAGDNVMSIHLKERRLALAKRGSPGSVELAEVSSEPLGRAYLEMMISQIVSAVHTTEQSTIEISKEGAMVFQHADYRIAITRPPFSDTIEITIVHPIAKLSIHDYDISDSLMERFGGRAEGIIISGAPGSGKSTLASGLGNFYNSQGKIVKTFESPRDLQVDPGVTQYGRLDGSFENSADVLLLVRPDYTIFDEVRRKEDFEIFADLRMTGVGMIGVVHANTPIDAIQRFIGKIELGMIPSILDTVIFVSGGRIASVYDLSLEVKVPSGMTESDLARPVIVVKESESGRALYEVYTFGEENVIVPVSAVSGMGDTDKLSRGVYRLAAGRILDVVRRYDRRAEVRMISEQRAMIIISKKHKARIIGKGGSKIDSLQEQLGLKLDVRTQEEAQKTGQIAGGTSASDDGTHEWDGSDSAGRRRGRRQTHDDDDDDGDQKKDSHLPHGKYGSYEDGYGDDMYDVSDEQHANNLDSNDPLQFEFKCNRNIIQMDVGRKYNSRNVEILNPDGTQIATAHANKRGVIKLSTRSSGGRSIMDMESPESDVQVRLLLD